MDATLARAEIVTWLEVDRLDAPSERCRAHEKVDVRSPYRSLDDRLVTRVTNEIAQQRYAIQTKSAERIRDTGYRHVRSERPRSEASQPTHWTRRRRGILGGDGSFGHDEISPALEAFDQLGQMFRLVGEVGLHDDHRVASRIAGTTRHLATERVQCARVPDMLLRSQDRERKDFGVRLQRLGGCVAAAVIEDEDLVLARILLKDFANPPEQKPDSGRFVVCRNADVQQRVPSKKIVR
jgi:hypothetical protein